jgi:hypothetical protein
MKNPFISIGESIHASIPKTGEIMRQLAKLGAEAYSRPSGPLNYIKALIESQADEGADYIAVNLDAFGEDDPQVAVDMMVEYVKMVRRWGKNVPICIDSSNDNVLIAGLKEWHNTDAYKLGQGLYNGSTAAVEKALRLLVHWPSGRRRDACRPGRLTFGR